MTRLFGLILISLFYVTKCIESSMIAPGSLRILTSSAETNNGTGIVGDVESTQFKENIIKPKKACPASDANENIARNILLSSSSVLNSDGSFTFNVNQMKSTIEINGTLRNINGTYTLEISGTYRHDNYNIRFSASEECGFQVQPYNVRPFITAKTISTIVG